MNARRDPMQAAAEIMGYIYQEAKKYTNAVATIGKARVIPGGINVIPQQVEFTLDLRDIELAVRDRLEQAIHTFAHEVCQRPDRASDQHAAKGCAFAVLSRYQGHH